MDPGQHTNRIRTRREPERGALHRVLREHLATFLAQADGLPRFVRRELERYLTCGLLAFGFARVWCSSCRRDELVAFSCKGRGFCPSCGGRRMADLAAHLVDDVLPHVPQRQWVLTFPYPIRLLLAYDPKLCASVRRIFTRVVLGWLRRRAEREGHADPRAGAVVFAQRFGSALNLNLHFHAIVTDGVFTCAYPFERAVFHPVPRPEDQDILELTRTLRRRIVCHLQRLGRLPREDADPPCADETGAEEPLLARISAASVQGWSAATGKRDQKIGRHSRYHGGHGTRADFTPGALCSEVDGFTLHARTVIADDDRDALERLCRYTARPPIASERLSLAEDGRMVYRLRHPWRDGTAAVAFDPLTFIERLAALVPRPRTHLLTYHGVLAPAAQWRDLVAPVIPPSPPTRSAPDHDPPDASPSRSRRLSWAELLKRVFAIDVLTCPRCGGRRELIATITDGPVVRRILEHLGLSADPPPLAPARSPTEPAFDW